MDIDRLSTEEREKHFCQGLCFICHKQGHLSRACPDKGKGKEANTSRKGGKTYARITEVEEDDDDGKSTASSDATDRTLVANRIKTYLKGLDNETRREVLQGVIEEGF